MFRRDRWWLGVGAIVMLAFGSMLSGCSKPLFPKDEPRSPYERYAQLRGDAAPKTQRNAFGIDEPALRERLRPMDRP